MTTRIWQEEQGRREYKEGKGRRWERGRGREDRKGGRMIERGGKGKRKGGEKRDLRGAATKLIPLARVSDAGALLPASLHLYLHHFLRYPGHHLQEVPCSGETTFCGTRTPLLRRLPAAVKPLSAVPRTPLLKGVPCSSETTSCGTQETTSSQNPGQQRTRRAHPAASAPAPIIPNLKVPPWHSKELRGRGRAQKMLENGVCPSNIIVR